jgi:hypothetical protein
MPRNGTGTYSLPAGNPVVTGTTISSTWANNTLSDIATGLTNSLAKDGQTTPTANLPMGGFKFTNMGVGSANTDSLTLGQAQNEAYQYLASVAGTDTITASTSPITASYVAGQTYKFVAANTNTGAATINLNGLGAKSITKYGATALAAADIVQNATYQIVYDGTQFQLINPSTVNLATDSVTAIKLADSAFGFTLTNGTFTATVAANALTIAIKTFAGTDPSATDVVKVVFRNSSLTSGVYSVVDITSALSLVVSSGSTLGTSNNVEARLALVVINNAGTAELAIINSAGLQSLSEIGVISTTAEGGAGGADSASVFYSTTSRSNVPYRVFGFIDITEATAGTWATAPTLLQNIGGQDKLNRYGMVQVNTADGYGSTNTRIRKFTNIVANLGTDITYATSAADGASFTINTSGYYTITYNDQFNAQSNFGISVNSTQLTTAIASITQTNILSFATTAQANLVSSTSWTGYLTKGDVVRAHTTATATGTSTTGCQFTISRVA